MDTKEASRCLEWELFKNPLGYGMINLSDRPGPKYTALAHRWAWVQVNGPIPARLVVRHRCDNPGCVRIDHLELGTQAENVRDAVVRGRWRKAHHSTFSDGDIAFIRHAGDRAPRGMQTRLAELFEVSVATITSIIHRKTFK